MWHGVLLVPTHPEQSARMMPGTLYPHPVPQLLKPVSALFWQFTAAVKSRANLVTFSAWAALLKTSRDCYRAFRQSHFRHHKSIFCARFYHSHNKLSPATVLWQGNVNESHGETAQWMENCEGKETSQPLDVLFSFVLIPAACFSKIFSWFQLSSSAKLVSNEWD